MPYWKLTFAKFKILQKPRNFLYQRIMKFQLIFQYKQNKSLQNIFQLMTSLVKGIRFAAIDRCNKRASNRYYYINEEETILFQRNK